MTNDVDDSTENNNGQLDTVDNETDPEGLANEVRVGSFVQWTSQGVNQFSEPQQIARIDERDGERFAYFEGKGYVPMSQVSLAEPTSKKSDIVLLKPAEPKAPELPTDGYAKERKQLDEGPAEITWPDKMTKESFEGFEYWLQGCIRRARRKAGLDAAPKNPK